AIDWADDTSAAGAVSLAGSGRVVVAGSHTWAAPGTYAITVNAQDNEPGEDTTAASHRTLRVGGAPLAGASVEPLTGTERVLLDGVTVAAFHAGSNTGVPNGATIDWGDGSRSGGAVVDLGEGLYAVQGSHAYPKSGTYTVTVAAGTV